METIRTWLNDGGTYQAGVDLLLQHTQDPGLHELFTQEMETDFKRKLLRQELLQVLKSNAQPAKPPNTGPAKVSEAATAAQVPATGGPGLASEKLSKKSPGRWSHPSQMDQIEKDLHDTWHPLFLEMCHLQNTIYDVAKAGTKPSTTHPHCLQDPAKKKEAQKMAFRILDLARQCKQLYIQRDQYLYTGAVPVDDSEQYAVDPAIAWKEMQNAERYVRQMKRNLAKNPDDENSKRLLAKHQAAVDHYKKFFNK